jgi:hypothetical protein
MENVQTQTTAAKTAPVKEKTDKLPEKKFKARAFYDFFEDEKTKEKRQYLAILMSHPFDSALPDVKLNFSSDKYKDDDGRKRKDRAKSWFKYQVEKLLRTRESVALTGVLQRKQYLPKDEKKPIEFTAILLDNEFNKDKPHLAMYIRDADAAAVLDQFCINSLQLVRGDLPEDTYLDQIN